MWEFCRKQYIKYKEVINYLIFGVLTTLVNFVVYIILTKALGEDEVFSNVIAWIVSVLFAYITNKIYVFESKTEGLKSIVMEIVSFVGCRLFSGVVDNGSFFVLVKLLNMNDMIAKILISVLVVILNYVFSKLIIFRDKKKTSSN